MDIIKTALGAVGGFIAGWSVGYALGRRVRQQAPWRYWALNAAALGVGTSFNVIGLTSGTTWLWVAAVAFIGASLSGLKYGRGVNAGGAGLILPPPSDSLSPGPTDAD